MSTTATVVGALLVLACVQPALCAFPVIRVDAGLTFSPAELCSGSVTCGDPVIEGHAEFGTFHTPSSHGLILAVNGSHIVPSVGSVSARVVVTPESDTVRAAFAYGVLLRTPLLPGTEPVFGVTVGGVACEVAVVPAGNETMLVWDAAAVRELVVVAGGMECEVGVEAGGEVEVEMEVRNVAQGDATVAAFGMLEGITGA